MPKEGQTEGTGLLQTSSGYWVALIYITVPYYFIPAVRLGRCPKKDKARRLDFFKLPQVTRLHWFISRCLIIISAVRLGRCPKKDKARRLDFFKLPQVTRLHWFISRCLIIISAVRLGRCPKKDKPRRLDFFKLPQVTRLHWFISRCLIIISAVRLGRCPKKDKPRRLDFFKLPQNQQGKVDIDKQIKSEQMILTIHESFRTALGTGSTVGIEQVRRRKLNF